MHKMIRAIIISLFFIGSLTSVYTEDNSKNPCHPWCEIDENGEQIHYDYPPISTYKQHREGS